MLTKTSLMAVQDFAEQFISLENIKFLNLFNSFALSRQTAGVRLG